MRVSGWHGAWAPALPAALREDSVGWHHDRTRVREGKGNFELRDFGLRETGGRFRIARFREGDFGLGGRENGLSAVNARRDSTKRL